MKARAGKDVRGYVNVTLSVCQGCLSRQIAMSRHMTPIPGIKTVWNPLFMLFVIGVLRAISWIIFGKHMKFTVSWPLLSLINVSMRTLLCPALPPPPCACAAAVRIVQLRYGVFTTTADLNAVFFCFLSKHFIFFLFFCAKQKFLLILSGVL